MQVSAASSLNAMVQQAVKSVTAGNPKPAPTPAVTAAAGRDSDGDNDGSGSVGGNLNVKA
jgi:hypothetical protein